MRYYPLCLLALGLTACAITSPPTTTTSSSLAIPSQWDQATADNIITTQALDLRQWWQQFQDPVLNQLINTALSQNTDLAQAQAKLREVRARQASTEATLWPNVTVNAGSSSTQVGSTRGNKSTLAVDASWEADIFGARHHAAKAAAADSAVIAANLAATQVSLAAEIATNYMQWRALQARLALIRDNLARQEATVQLTQWQAEAGLTTRLAVEQAISSAEQTRAQIPTLSHNLAATGHRLTTLLGQTTPLPALEAVAPLPVVPNDFALNIPAETLRQRPDVIAAEHKLLAEAERVSQAQAKRYPSLSLSGSLGLQAASLGLTQSNVLQSLAANISSPIFDAGNLRQQVLAQQAVHEQALANYRSTLLTALEEVENALNNLSQLRQRLLMLDTAAQAAADAASLAHQQYQAGLVGFQTVLDSERSQLTLEDSRVSCQADLATAAIQLYKALGGGWSTTVSAGKSS